MSAGSPIGEYVAPSKEAPASGGGDMEKYARPVLRTPFLTVMEGLKPRRVQHDVNDAVAMNGIDKVFAELQHAQPANPMFISSLFITERMPQPAHVRSALEALVEKNPRLTFCMDDGARPSRWVSCAVDVADHCELVTMTDSGPVPDEDLDWAVGSCMSITLPLDKQPAWRQYVIPMASSRCAILTYIHHSYSDGQGGVGALLSLVRREDGREPESWAPKQKAAVLRLRSKDFDEDSDEEEHKYSKRTRAKASLGRWLSLLGRALYLLLAMLLASVTLPLKGLRTVFTRKRTFTAPQRFPDAAKRTAWTRSLRLGAVREIKEALAERWRQGRRAPRVTINDVMLGVLSSAFAAHIEERDTKETSIYAGIPFSFLRRGPTDGRLANFSIILPLFWKTRTSQPLEAVETFHKTAEAMKRDAAGEGPILWFGTSVLLSLFPPLLKLPGTEFLMQRMSAVLTNVPGPRDVCEFAGQKIIKFIPFAPSPSAGALGIAMISYADSYTVGIYTDASSDAHRAHVAVARLFEAKFAELAAELGVSQPFVAETQ